jgi:glucose-1-phosphate cytidylyltransferase
MKVVLFCGGRGIRLQEGAETIPKPMVPVGHHPILWHLMQYYRHHQHHEFILCLGYKGNLIKRWFLDYHLAMHSDFSIHGHGTRVELLDAAREDWRAALIDTGVRSSVAERLAAAREHVEGEEMFLANYSDVLSDVALPEMIAFFRASGKTACFLATRPNFSYHVVDFAADGRVEGLRTGGGSEIWIDGGFFIFRPRIFEFVRPGDDLVAGPIRRLIEAGELVAFPHRGFWASMDTLKDKRLLEDMLEQGDTPWLPWTRDRAAG